LTTSCQRRNPDQAGNADHDEIGVLALPEARSRDVVAINATCVERRFVAVPSLKS
jgi:hypothetical protein